MQRELFLARLSSIMLRGLSVSVQLAGAVAALLAAAELLDGGSVGVHVSGGLRWLFFCVALSAGLLALFGAGRDALSRAGHGMGPAMLRHLFVLAVFALAAQVMLSHTPRGFLFRLCSGTAAGIFAGLRLGARASPRRLLRALDRITFQVCLVVVLLELGLRALAGVLPSPLLSRPQEDVATTMARYRYAPGALRYGFPCNSGGHYDEEFTPDSASRFTVVSIGDSFSVGVVPHRFHYTSVAERALAHTAILNLGHAALGPGAYLHLLVSEGLALHPDLILIDLFLGNDLQESWHWHSDSLLASFCDRRNLLIWQVPRRLLRLLGESRRLATTGHGPGTLQGEDLLKTPTSDERRLRAAMPWLEDPSREEATFSQEAFLRIECKRAHDIHEADRRGSYGQLFAVLDAIGKAARDTPLAIMLIPDQFQVDEELWQKVSARLGRITLQRDQPQRRIAQGLRRRHTPYLDLLPILRAVPRGADGHRHLYHLRDTHFNAHGNRVAGEALARFLRGLRR